MKNGSHQDTGLMTRFRITQQQQNSKSSCTLKLKQNTNPQSKSACRAKLDYLLAHPIDAVIFPGTLTDFLEASTSLVVGINDGGSLSNTCSEGLVLAEGATFEAGSPSSIVGSIVLPAREAESVDACGGGGATYAGSGVGVVGNSGGYLEAPPQQVRSRDGTKYRVVGLGRLRKLLQPKHLYYEGAEGYIDDYAYYDDNGVHLCYPRLKSYSCEHPERPLKGWHKRNPYHKHLLRQKHVAKTVKKLQALGVDKFAVVVLTLPKEVSTWLSQQDGDEDMAWRLFKRFWNKDYSTLDDESSGQAAYVNLHKWKTKCPLEPHYHFHSIIPGYRLVDEGIQDEDGNNALKLEEKPWHKQRGGQLVPYSDEALDLLKQKWHSRLVAFARRHGLKGDWMDDYKGIDVFVEYVVWDSDIGKAKLINKLNYQSRHWLEDYAEYSNGHLDCEYPPGWLENYSNSAHTFGWWSRMKSVVAGVDMNSKEKLSPISGKPMEYKGTISLEGLLRVSGGKLGYLDFYKGKPIEGEMTEEDIKWLRSVMWHPPS